jgi:hypothetical protein
MRPMNFCMPTYAQRMLTTYEKARLEGSKISNRKKLAAHWLAKQDWFGDELARTCQIEADLKVIHIPVPTRVSEASVTLISIVEVCQDYYELYA